MRQPWNLLKQTVLEQDPSIDVRHHYMRKKVADVVIKLEYISTEEMVADSLTKAVHGPKHFLCTNEAGLVHI